MNDYRAFRSSPRDKKKGLSGRVGLYVAAALTTALLGFSGGMWGKPLYQALLSDVRLSSDASEKDSVIQAWIAPPDYTYLPTVPLATSSNIFASGKHVRVPEGSVIHIHLASAKEPFLQIGAQKLPFDKDQDGSFIATRRIGHEELGAKDGRLYLLDEGRELAHWDVSVLADEAPRIELKKVEKLKASGNLAFLFDGEDDFDVGSLALRVTPLYPSPDQPHGPVDVSLSVAHGKHLQGVAVEDLAWLPWAGQMAEIQMVATDGAGHEAVSRKETIQLPQRDFKNPLARALAEERKHLLAVHDANARNEAANIMAGIAHQPITYRGDPLILMALRSGAVRLVFDRSEDSVSSVADILWRSAVRIEDAGRGDGKQRSAMLLVPWRDNKAPSGSEKEPE